MDYSFKVAISGCQWGGVSYRGFGRDGRQYSIHKHKTHFTASLIAGEGQPITVMGRSPMEAVARAESLHEGDVRYNSHHGNTPDLAGRVRIRDEWSLE